MSKFKIEDFLNDIHESPEQALERVKDVEEASETNPTCISYWLPLIPSDIPTPKTTLVRFPYRAQVRLIDFLEGSGDEGVIKALAEDEEYSKIASELLIAAEGLGDGPVFLKSGIFSGKHGWLSNCFVSDKNRIFFNAGNILYDWMCYGGSDQSNYFAVREMIKTSPELIKDGMPVANERRYFVEDGKVKWHQPYWPEDAFKHADEIKLLKSHPDFSSALFALRNESKEEFDLLSEMAVKVSACIPGAWSVDFLLDENGKWWLIDMAPASKSYKENDYGDGLKWID